MANHPGDANWRQLLPYAHKYLRHTWFSGSEDDAEIPLRWYTPARGLPRHVGLSQDQTTIHFDPFVTSGSCSIRVGWYETLLQFHYWEMKICGHKCLEGCPVSVGYDEIISYSSSGTISSPGEFQLNTESFVSDHDVIGCGFVHPRTFFFIKNGRHLGNFEVHGSRKWYCVKPRVEVGPGSRQAFDIRANFGQQPFVFGKMEEICAEKYRRSTRVAATIPVEILEQILLEALERLIESLDYNYIDIARYGRQSLDRLSLVCRRWHTVSSVVRSHYLTIRSSAEFSQALSLPSLSKLQVLLTNEDRSDPWIHRLLVSPLPTLLTSLTKWTCDPQNIQFLDHLPPNISRAAPSLFRANFSNVRTLRLDSHTFSRWSHFCRIVYAFPHLDNLVMYEIKWNDVSSVRSPSAVPPYYQRLREVVIPDVFLSRGHLWLFIAGRPQRSPDARDLPSRDLLLSPEDTVIIAEILALMADICPASGVTYVPEKQQCTLLWWSEFNVGVRFTFMSLTFERCGERYYYLKHIQLAFESQDINIEESSARLDVLLGRLSSADTCTCNVHLTGRKLEVGHPWLANQATTAETHDIFHRVWRKMTRRRMAGLLDFTYAGEVFRVSKGMEDHVPVLVIVTPNARTVWTVSQLCTIKWLHSSMSSDDVAPFKSCQMHHSTNKTAVFDLTLDVDLHSESTEFLVPDVKPGKYYITGAPSLMPHENF